MERQACQPCPILKVILTALLEGFCKRNQGNYAVNTILKGETVLPTQVLSTSPKKESAKSTAVAQFSASLSPEPLVGLKLWSPLGIHST